MARLVAAIEQALGPTAPAPSTGPVDEPIVDRDDLSEESEESEVGPVGTIPPYRLASLTVETGGRELAEVKPDRLASWIVNVVGIEGPVHAAEVARRIAEAAGVKRIGPRIQAALEQGFDLATRKGKVRREGDFLWPGDMTEPPLRDRSGLPAASKKLEWVSPEEIGRAIERVVLDALGMEPDAIPPAACRLLGFPRFGDDNRKRVEAIRDDLIARGRLARRGGHLVIAQASANGLRTEDSGLGTEGSGRDVS